MARSKLKRVVPKTCAVIYARVSTDKQSEGFSLIRQTAECKALCDANGWEILGNFSEAESATSLDRAQFQRAIMLCLKERKRVGWFIVNDIDRFSREVKDFHEVKTTLEKAGIQLVAASSPGDGEFMQGLKALLAQEDNRRRAERTKHGMVTAARAGKFQHRSPIGYTLINRGIKGNVVKLQPDDKLAPLINRAFLLIAQGKSQHEARMAITDLGFRTAEGV